MIPGFDYSNWLELLIVNIQVFIVHVLARYYLNEPKKLITLLLCKAVMVTVLTFLPLSYIQLIMKCFPPLMIYNKTNMLYKHYKDKSTGQMAGSTLYMQLFQFSGRLFTVIMTGNSGFLPVMFLNWLFQLLYVLQYLWYGGEDEKETDKKKE